MVDLNSFEIIESLRTGKNPVGIKIDQTGEKIIVCDSNQVNNIFEPYKDTISVLNIDSRAVTKRLYIAHAGKMELSPDGDHAIIARFSGKKIFFYPLSGERGIDLNINYKIRDISISSDGIYCLVATRSHPPKLIKVDISSRTVIDEFIIGKYHTPLLVKPTSKRHIAYILTKGWNTSQGRLILMDCVSGLAFQTIAVGHAPGGLDINPTGTKIYVINEAENTISVADVIKAKVIEVIPLKQPKHEFWPLAIENVFDRLKLVPTKHLIVATDYSDKKILFVKTNAGHTTKTLALRFKPAFLEVAPNQNLALVAGFGRGNYALVDLNNLSLKKQWHMKGQIHGVSFVSNDEIALSHYTPQKGYRTMFVSLSDGTERTIPIEKWVDEVIADSQGEFVYVASSLNGKVYKIEVGKGIKQYRIVEIIEVDGFPIQLELDEMNNNLILPNYKFNKLGVYSLVDRRMRSEAHFQERLVELQINP